MARLSLATRAARYGQLLSQDQSTLSQRNRGERTKLLRAIGISEAQWDRYAPSTRRKYVAAAKRGNTATQERERVREQRARRRQRQGPGIRDKRAEIERLRQKIIAEGMNTERGLGVDADGINSDVLLEKEAVEDHIRYYGVDYVLQHLTDMWDSVDSMVRGDPRPGNWRWKRFKATPRYEDADDERWYWYHTSPYPAY